MTLCILLHLKSTAINLSALDGSLEDGSFVYDTGHSELGFHMKIDLPMFFNGITAFCAFYHLKGIYF